MSKILLRKTTKSMLVLCSLIGILVIFLPSKTDAVGSSALLVATNSARTAAGLQALSSNHTLDKSAQMKANDLCTNNYWAHTSPDGQTAWGLISIAGYKYKMAGENLAKGFSSDSEVIDGWLNSPAHRANLMNSNYREVGLAKVACKNKHGTFDIVVAHYGQSKKNSLTALFESAVNVVKLPFEKVFS